MNLDFWDLTQLNILLNVRDYYRDKEAAERQQEEYEIKVKRELLESGAELGDLVLSVFQKANPSELPREAGEGILLLPFFCFSQALGVQRGPVTRAQREVLDLFTRKLSVNFGTEAFLTDNGMSRKIHRSVGITMEYAGSFWNLFFKCVYVTEESTDVLEKLAQRMTAVVLRFAVLGKADLDSALALCEGFLQILAAQAVKAYDLPESEIDYFGEASYIVHKQRAENLALSAVRAAGDEGKLDMESTLSVFFLGLLYDLIDRAKGTVSEKEEMMQFAMQSGQVTVPFAVDHFFAQMKCGASEYDGVRTIKEQFLSLLSIVCGRADCPDNVVEFAQESTNFLIGIEKKLAAVYPRQGFGRIASPLMSEKIDVVLGFMKA